MSLSIILLFTGAFLAGLFGRKVGALGCFLFRILKTIFKKNFIAVKASTNTVITTISNVKLFDLLKQLPRWAERIGRLYLLRKNQLLDRALRDILSQRPLPPECLEECLKVLVQVVITYFFLTYDFLNYEYISACWNSGPPSDQLIDYITASQYLNATPAQLDQLAAGDPSMLSDDQLRNFDQRYNDHARHQKLLNPKWYDVRWDIIVIAVLTYVFGT